MENSCNDCTAHGRLDQRVEVLERDVREMKDDQKNRNKSNWQVVISIGLAFLSVAFNLLMAWMKGV